MLEAVLKEKVHAYLPQFFLLTSWQNGFLYRSPTLTNLIVAEELVAKWLNEGSAVDLTYLDFSKGLDLPKDWQLLAKLRENGIVPIVINCAESFISRSKGWELDFNPTKIEHLPIGNCPHYFIYTLQPIHIKE